MASGRSVGRIDAIPIPSARARRRSGPARWNTGTTSTNGSGKPGAHSPGPDPGHGYVAGEVILPVTGPRTDLLHDIVSQIPFPVIEVQTGSFLCRGHGHGLAIYRSLCPD